MKTSERVLAAAMTPAISHGAIRLYVILDGASRQAGAVDDYFPVTLQGLMDLHPGTAGRTPGSTTVIKQVDELRKHGLLDRRAALHRNEPSKPVLIKVLTPSTSTVKVDGKANRQ